MEPIQDPISAIIEAAQDPNFGLQNPFLELASLSLEAKHAGLAYDRLKPTWERMRDERRARRGVFLRKPNDTSISTSHDEWIGLAVCSYLFDGGETAREILDEGLTFGLWMTGRNEKGYWFDSEWVTPLRPEYRAIMKLAAGRRITFIEDLFMRGNIWLSRAWNMKRVRLLFLDAIGYDLEFVLESLTQLGELYRGRYGSNPLYWNIWAKDQ